MIRAIAILTLLAVPASAADYIVPAGTQLWETVAPEKSPHECVEIVRQDQHGHNVKVRLPRNDVGTFLAFQRPAFATERTGTYLWLDMRAETPWGKVLLVNERDLIAIEHDEPMARKAAPRCDPLVEAIRREDASWRSRVDPDGVGTGL